MDSYEIEEYGIDSIRQCRYLLNEVMKYLGNIKNAQVQRAIHILNRVDNALLEFLPIEYASIGCEIGEVETDSLVKNMEDDISNILDHVYDGYNTLFWISLGNKDNDGYVPLEEKDIDYVIKLAEELRKYPGLNVEYVPHFANGELEEKDLKNEKVLKEWGLFLSVYFVPTKDKKEEG